ncbi:winged helix-turn-helix transcriptional regulator [Streptacidiphilus neutrinimicus]|uniref:winged helix-turn-helix transcriptional regulator n=1 Tax=Streptacidiphilus neutrinimicus TaxID=105420 RepID=UPI0005A94C19|nr:winged helix-turn-helix transcriptional regulator [Streptacidiphilus neutrinimicus]
MSNTVTLIRPASSRRLQGADDVQEAIESLAPRWTTWTMQLVTHHKRMRYAEVAAAMTWISPGSLQPRLRAMQDGGLLARTSSGEYLPTSDGLRLSATYEAMGAWGLAHRPAAEPVARAEHVERSLSALSRSYTTHLLWAVEPGPTSRAELLELLPQVPEGTLPGRLIQLTEDGLLSRSGAPRHYRYELTAAGRALAPSWDALQRWNRGEDAAPAAGSVVAAAVSRAQAAVLRGAVPPLVFSHVEPPPPPFVQHAVAPSRAR